MKDKQPDSKSIPPAAHRPTAGTSIAPQRPGQRKYTLALLLTRLGRIDDAAIRQFVAHAPTDAIVALGGRAATKRIVRDGTRILGEAVDFLQSATPEQAAQLPGATDQFLSAMGTSLERASTQQSLLDGSRRAASTQRTSSSATLGSALSKARGRREVLYTAASLLTAGDTEQHSCLEAAKGTAGNADAAANALEAMVPITRELVRAAAKRGVKTRLSEAFLAESLAIAADVRSAGEDAEASVERGGVTQGGVDWWDGAALWFVRGLVESFDAAHEADATIPRLQVITLRGVLTRGRRTKKTAKIPAPTPPAPPVQPTP